MNGIRNLRLLRRRIWTDIWSFKNSFSKNRYGVCPTFCLGREPVYFSKRQIAVADFSKKRQITQITQVADYVSELRQAVGIEYIFCESFCCSTTSS